MISGLTFLKNEDYEVTLKIYVFIHGTSAKYLTVATFHKTTI